MGYFNRSDSWVGGDGCTVCHRTHTLLRPFWDKVRLTIYYSKMIFWHVLWQPLENRTSRAPLLSWWNWIRLPDKPAGTSCSNSSRNRVVISLIQTPQPPANSALSGRLISSLKQTSIFKILIIGAILDLCWHLFCSMWAIPFLSMLIWSDACMFRCLAYTFSPTFSAFELAVFLDLWRNVWQVARPHRLYD